MTARFVSKSTLSRSHSTCNNSSRSVSIIASFSSMLIQDQKHDEPFSFCRNIKRMAVMDSNMETNTLSSSNNSNNSNNNRRTRARTRTRSMRSGGRVTQNDHSNYTHQNAQEGCFYNRKLSEFSLQRMLFNGGYYSFINIRTFSSSSSSSSSSSFYKGEKFHEIGDEDLRRTPKRVWKSIPATSTTSTTSTSSAAETTVATPTNKKTHDIWRTSVDEGDLTSMKDVVNRISVQEKKGGRMRQRKLGVLREDPKEDMRLLIENYTVPAIASALRDREDTLQHCASLISENKIDELKKVLRPYESRYVDERRQVEINLDMTKNGFDTSNLEILRKGLNRMPRRVSQAHRHRAGVVLPLCNVDGIPCILFEKRSPHLRAHPDEVCLPGGMVSSANDKSIVATCLREMAEEIEGIDEKKITVLGVLRCNWGEVHHLVGVAVTPVVCFIGDVSSLEIRPSPDEVAECFTVPLDLFLDDDHWVHKQDFAPMFTGGPYPIWGLTGYILHRFVKDVLARFRVQSPSYGSSSFRHPKFRP